MAIVGAGISGLAVAHELRRREPRLAIVIVEKDDTSGGLVRSTLTAGYTLDWGPNGFQPAEATLKLVERLALTDRLTPASGTARSRYLFRDGGLRQVPVKPQQFLATELLSPVAKLRAGLEPLLSSRSKRVSGQEESVFDFVARHFGRQVASRLAEPMVLGVTAGDARKLSLDALFPRLRKMEAEHGSLLRAMARSGNKSSENGGRAGAALYSFSPGGMGVLTEALTVSLADSLRTGSQVSSVEPVAGGGWNLQLAGGGRISAEKVVLAAPAQVSARLLEPLSRKASDALAGIVYADVSVLAFGYDRIDVPHRLDGFGFLAPRGEGVRSLGVLWSSSLFGSHAPERTVLLRVIAGGAVDPGFAALSDSDAIELARRDLRVTMGITARPLLAQRIALPAALPQYELGHRERVSQAMTQVRRFPGLALAGNGYYGIAVNDCIREAGRVVDEILIEC